MGATQSSKADAAPDPDFATLDGSDGFHRRKTLQMQPEEENGPLVDPDPPAAPQDGQGQERNGREAGSADDDDAKTEYSNLKTFDRSEGNNSFHRKRGTSSDDDPDALPVMNVQTPAAVVAALNRAIVDANVTEVIDGCRRLRVLSRSHSDALLLYDEFGDRAAVAAITMLSANQAVAVQALAVLVNMATSPACCERFPDNAFRSIVSCMTQLVTQAHVQELACMALQNSCRGRGRGPRRRRRVAAQAGAIEAVVNMMGCHRVNVAAMRAGITTLRNLVESIPELSRRAVKECTSKGLTDVTRADLRTPRAPLPGTSLLRCLCCMTSRSSSMSTVGVDPADWVGPEPSSKARTVAHLKDSIASMSSSSKRAPFRTMDM